MDEFRYLMLILSTAALLAGFGILAVELWRAITQGEKFTCDDCPNKQKRANSEDY